MEIFLLKSSYFNVMISLVGNRVAIEMVEGIGIVVDTFLDGLLLRVIEVEFCSKYLNLVLHLH